MQLRIDSFNGTSLQTSSFSAYFTKNTVMLHQGVTPVTVEREDAAPKLVYKARKAATWTIGVHILSGTLSSQVDVLKALFDPNDQDEHPLKATDLNTSTQYYVNATCVDVVELSGTDLLLKLLVTDPLWTAVTGQTDTDGLTATGQTLALTVGGSLAVAPVISYQPTSAKDIAVANAYRHLVTLYNKAFYGVSGINSIIGFPDYPIEITNGGLDTAALVADASNNCLLNGAINASVTTIDYDTVTGTLPSIGMGYVDTEQIKWTGKSGTQLTGVTRGIGGTTAASHADNAVLYVSKCLANGDDFQLVVDGVPQDFWFGTGSNAMNQAATKIWSTFDLTGLSSIGNYQLASAIAASGPISSIAMRGSGVYSFPTKGLAIIGTEIFQYTALDLAGGSLSGVTRAVLGTSEAGHSAGDTVYILAAEIWLIYGDKDASERQVDDSYKPLIELTSTNTSWVYADFYDTSGLRPYGWGRNFRQATSPAAARISNFYTTSQNPAAGSNPAAVMGMGIAAYLKGKKYKAETAEMTWYLVHPAGATSITVSGYKYRIGSTWPGSVAGITVNTYSTTQANIWNEASPSSAGSWQALSSHSGVSLGGTRISIGWGFQGTINGTGAVAYMEATDITITLDSARVPTVSLGSVIDSSSGYPLDVTITNTTTGEWLRVQAQIELNVTCQIDCVNKTVKRTDTGADLACVLTFSSKRHNWLDVSAGDELQFDETGMTGATVTAVTYNRAI